MKNKLIVAAGVLTAIVAITLCGWIMFSPSVEDGTKTTAPHKSPAEIIGYAAKTICEPLPQREIFSLPSS